MRDTGDAYTVVAWDLATRSDPIVLGPGFDFRFLPGTDDLVAAELDSPTLTVYDLEPDGTIQKDRQITRPDVPFEAMAVDPSGRSVAVASLVGRRVDVLDLTTGASRATLDMPSPGQPEFSRDGHLAVAGGDNLIRIYDTTDYAQQLVLAGSPDQPIGLAFSPDSSRLVSAVPGQLRTWNLSPQGPPALGNFHATGGYVGLFAVSPDRSTALVTIYKDGNGTVERVDQATGNITDGDRRSTPRPASDDTALGRHGAGRRPRPELAGPRARREHRAVHPARPLRRHRRPRRLRRHGPRRRRVALRAEPRPDTATIARATRVEPRRRHGDRPNRPRPRHDASSGEAPSARPAPMGALASSSSRTATGTIHVRDLATGADLGSFAPARGGLLKAAVTPDGQRLALTTSIGDLIVVDLGKLAHAGRPEDAVIWTVKAHSGSVQGLAVSNDGLIATASSAGTVRVWSPDGRLLADLPIRPDDPPNVAFASGTDTLYYEDGNDVIRKLSLDPAESIRFARSLVTRDFTPDECTRYFPHQHCPTFDS